VFTAVHVKSVCNLKFTN